MNKTLIAVLLFASATTTYASDALTVETALLESDLSESLKMKPDCDTVVASLRKNQFLPSLETQEQYKEVLTDFKRYPRTPENSWKGLQTLISAPYLFNELDLDPIYKTYGCNQVALFDAGKLLITSANSLKLTRKEKKDFIQSILERVSYDMKSGRPNLFTFLTDFNLITMMMAAHFINVSDPIYIEMMHLDRDAVLLKRELQVAYNVRPRAQLIVKKFVDLGSDEQKNERAILMKELSGTDSLRSRLSWLLNRISVATAG